MKKETNQERSRILDELRKEINERLEDKHWDDQPLPIINAGNIRYEMSEKTRAINCGGIGALHTMVVKIGLDKCILQRHYWVGFRDRGVNTDGEEHDFWQRQIFGGPSPPF